MRSQGAGEPLFFPFLFLLAQLRQERLQLLDHLFCRPLLHPLDELLRIGALQKARSGQWSLRSPPPLSPVTGRVML